MGYMYEGSYYGDDDTHDEYGGDRSDLIDELRDVISDRVELGDDFAAWLNDQAGSDVFWRFWCHGEDCDDIIRDYLDQRLENMTYGLDDFMGVTWVEDREDD